MINGLISVVIPIHKIQKNFLKVRSQLHNAITPIEIIYVINEKLRDDILITTSNEQIIRIPNRGRGYMLEEGARQAKGEIILFLHSDTILPRNWDIIIHRVMKNKRVIGGGFSLQFDINSLYLTFMLNIITIFVHLTKALSGDRAMFVRFKPLQKDLSILEVPIMEDAELSNWMKKQGKIILLKESVVTSADAFVQNGLIHHTWKIIKCSIWYKLGIDLQKIYNYYYS